MERTHVIIHKGMKILFLDLSGLAPSEEMVSTLGELTVLTQSQPKGSVLHLFDVTGMHFDKRTLGMMKELSASDAPYVKASAVIGISGLLNIGLNAVNKFSGRNMKAFSSKEEALDWLAAQ